MLSRLGKKRTFWLMSQKIDGGSLNIKAGFSFLDNYWSYRRSSGKIILKPQQRGQGEFTLGDIVVEDFVRDSTVTIPFRITRDELNKHLLIVGETGMGKTNLNYLLLSQLLQQNDISCLIIDVKQDYRHLLPQFENLVVIPWKHFRFNPLSLPPSEFCDVFCQDSSLLLGSKGFLLEAVMTLQNQLARNPMPHELLQYLHTVKLHPFGREAQYLAVVKNRIKTLLLELGPVVNCREGFQIEDILGNNIVLELDLQRHPSLKVLLLYHRCILNHQVVLLKIVLGLHYRF